MRKSSGKLEAQVETGDVLAIPTLSGEAFVQVTHVHPQFGSLIRVLPGLYRERPDLGRLVAGPTAWVTFYPAPTGLKKGSCTKAGRYPVPPEARSFPIFRAAGLPDPRTHAVHEWWVWDGEVERRIGALRDDQWDLPPRQVLSHPTLVERLVSGWRPRDDQRRNQPATPDAVTEERSSPRHFVYFPKDADLNAIGSEARGSGFEVELRREDEDYVLVAWAPHLDIPAARAKLEDLASRHGGDCDGWVATPSSVPRDAHISPH